MDFDYWHIHEDERPTLNIHKVPAFFEGRWLIQCPVKVGQFYEQGNWLCAEEDWNSNHSQRVSDALKASGHLLPVELAGYPEYYEDHVLYKRWSTANLGPRKAMLASIHEGYESMRAKKIIGIIGRMRNYPEDCMQVIKEYLLPVPRNRAYH